MQHAYIQYGMSNSDIELKALQLMEEPLELELPAMLAYLPSRKSASTNVAFTMSR